MNHIYKVVWSRVRNCYVAVSEIAKGHGKKSPSEKWGGKKAALLAAVIFTLGIGGTVGAAGPAATEHGRASKADGIASIAVGVGDHVVSSNIDANRFQGATSLAVGTLNIVDADANAPFDGAASSVIGQVNYTKNANAAIIMGAGNKVTNSYRDVSGLDEATINKIMGYYQKGQMDKVTEILQKAVPNSGGQVMVMGGGNTVDYAQASQVMGVSNILKGTKDAASKYNLVDGFQNKVTNSQNTYVVGTKNNFVNMANSIVLGDNNNRIANNTDRIMKDTIVIGDGNTVQNGDESIAIGKNIHIKRDGGIGYEYDTGNVAIGSNAYISSYVNQGDSIAIGKNASVVNMNGSLEQAFAFGRTMGKDYSGSIAIGENAYARSGSTMIGVHDYQGKLGDMTIDFTKGKQEASSGIMDYSESIDATTIGNNSYNNGTFSTVLGSYSAVSGLYHNAQWGSKPYGVQNFGAAVVGSLNSVESLTSEDHNTAGMADSILGSANRTKNANGTVMVGAGNEVTNSINDFDASGIKVKGGIADPNTLSKAMRTAIQNQNGGGAAAVVGNGNIVDNATNVSVLGSKNSLKNTKKAQLLGDNRVVDSADNSVIVGSADSELTTSNKNVTVLGYNANASVDDGVALGSGSIASVDAGVFGWDPSTKAASTTDSSIWKSSWAAVSVGDAANKFTRQITNVAAGLNDTDAVNVAQLKAAMDNAGSKISLVAGDGIKIEGKDGTYTISANITGGKTDTDTTKVDGKTGTSGDSGSTDKGNTDTSGNGKQLVVTTDTNPTKFAADEGTAAEVKPSETLTINGDKTNIATKVDGNAISVKLNDDISVKTVNATDSIGIKDGPSMTKDGIDAAGKKITHVAAGTEATDAVNYGQLKDVESKVDSNSQAITNINSHVNRLDNRINKVGAGAAALAGLHPLDFDPSDKWNFAVGYGNYRNANSVAVGAFYRPNEDTMVSVGTNFGNGENMVNAGVSFKLGQGSSYAGVSKAELAEENQKLKANDAAQDQKIQNQEKEIQELKKALEELKSHIK
nr:ESPR-type extended signal peptide-containing protein [uncultured Dialister sp.]